MFRFFLSILSSSSFLAPSLSMASLSAWRGLAPVLSSSSRKQHREPLRAPASATRAQQRRRDASVVNSIQAAVGVDAASSTTTTTTSSLSPLPSPPSPSPATTRSLIGMPLEELEEFVESELGEPRARARHLFRWLYCGGGARVATAADEEGAESEKGRSPSPSCPPSWSDAPGPETPGGFSSAFLAKVSPFPSLLDAGIELVGVRRSADGTRKLLFLLTRGAARGKIVDAVLIPSSCCSLSSSPASSSSSSPAARLTLCVSSQAGCSMGCAFCLTGAQGLSGSLSASQIVGQLVAARQLLRSEEGEEEAGERGGGETVGGGDDITNVVFMGQGEPLDNLDAVVSSVRVMTDPRAGSSSSESGGGGGGSGAPPASSPPRQWSLSPNRVTVSTVGLVPQLRSLVSRCDAQVALSLHAADEGTRRGIVPATARHGTEELRAALEELFPRRRRRKEEEEQEEEESGGAACSSSSSSSLVSPSSPSSPPGRGKRRHVLIEMTLLSGVNDSDADAKLLLEFLSRVEAKVNLIPWNPHPGSPFSPPSAARVEAFKKIVQEGEDGKGTGEKRVCTVRMARGADEAMAACGQLGEVGRVPRAAARLLVEAREGGQRGLKGKM